MLIQRAGTGTLPPPGFTPPLWNFLSSQWSASPHLLERSTILGPCSVVLGHSDCEAEDFVEGNVEGHSFGWDNESPKREVWVKRFQVEWRPVSNDDYLRFLEGDESGIEVPKSWVVDGEGIKVNLFWSILKKKK
jgi:formylglycine-generating enzyme required for sulfatase activity